MFRKRLRFLGTIILTLVVMSGLGVYTWLQIGPENNVRMWLSDDKVQSGEPMSLYIRNLGSRQIVFGYRYEIYRVYENGTIELHTYDDDIDRAWPAVLIGLYFPGTWSQKIETNLEPGEYYVEKEYYFSYKGTHYIKKRYFTVVS